MADKIKLDTDEQSLYNDLRVLVDQSHEYFKDEGKDFKEQYDRTSEMARLAHDLHMKLTRRDLVPKHHKYMYENRGVPVEDEEFYNHLHPVEDLLKFIDDPDANNDPEDSTMGEKFDFRIYTRRWGHYDYYGLTRTVDGWKIEGGSEFENQANKKGKPALFEALKHDSVSYPRTLGIFLEQVWVKASEGANKEVIQEALNDLAEWISLCEKSTPRGIFEGLI